MKPVRLKYLVGTVLRMKRLVHPFLIDERVIVIETGVRSYRYKVRSERGVEGWVYEDDLKGELE